MTGACRRRSGQRLPVGSSFSRRDDMKHGGSIFYLLDHDRDVLVQVAAVELHQVYEDVKKVRGETDVHPQENEAR